MRCKLAAFNSDSTPVLDVTVERIGAISAKDLSACSEEIAAYPLAKVNPQAQLPLTGINPAWKDVFDKFKSLVVDVDFPKAKYITEEDWNAILAKFDAYSVWLTAKAGAEVEALGCERLTEILKENR